MLGEQSVALVDSPPSTDDWYANLLWVDQRKCLLVAHAGTLFALFVADIRLDDLRPFERRIVELLTSALLEEGLPSDALGRLEPNEVRLAKTASRHVLGVMNQMALEIGGTSTRSAASGTSTSTSSIATYAAASTPKTATTAYRSNSCTSDYSAGTRNDRQGSAGCDPSFRHPQATV